MLALQVAGVFAIVPTTILLTISFFVLFAIRKVDSEGLKSFGRVIVLLLWVSATVIFGAGLYTISTGHHPLVPTMREMMKCRMECPMMEKMAKEHKSGEMMKAKSGQPHRRH